jgi:VWFA-related protein
VAVANSFDFEENSLLRQIASVDLDESRMARGTVDTPTGTAPGVGIGQSLVGLETNPAFARLEDEALSLVPQLRAFAGMRHEHLQRGLGSMRRLVDAVAGVPGRKSVIYLSDGIELRPGELLFDSFWRRFRKLPKISGHFSPVVEVGAYDLTGEYLALIAEANAARVTFYPLNSSLPVNLERNSAASTARPTRDMRDWDARFSTTEADARESMMRLLADGTGGRTAASIAPVEPVLAASLDDFENYYSLGYQIPPDDERLGEQREFEVQTKLPGLRVRYRRSGVDKSADSVMVEKTMSGLLIDVEENPLEVVLHTEPAKADGEGVFVVPISVELPMARLVLMPAEEVHQAQVALFVAVLDGRQRTSEVSKNLCPIRIRNDQLASSLSRPVSCGLRLRMRSGPQRVSIGVRDELAAVDSVVSVEVDVGADVPVAGGG